MKAVLLYLEMLVRVGLVQTGCYLSVGSAVATGGACPPFSDLLPQERQGSCCDERRTRFLSLVAFNGVGSCSDILQLLEFKQAQLSPSYVA